MDYTPFLPPYDNQHSTAGSADAMDCVSEAFTHAIEIALAKRGQVQRFSPRALAKLANTQPTGNSVGAVLQAVQKYGMIPYEAWPDLQTFTWAEYYADIPQSVIDLGQEFLKKWKVEFTTPNLDNDPVMLEIVSAVIITPTGPKPSMTHFVVQINDTQYFDSYMPDVKTINPTNVLAQFQLSLTPVNQTNMALAKKTLNLDGEIGVFISVSDPASLSDLNTAFGVNVTPNADGSIPTDVVAHKQ